MPRPRTLPVECWQPIVSASQRGLDLMAKHGIKGVIGGGAATGGARPEVVSAWRDTLARHGRETELGGDLIIGMTTYIAGTEEQAIEEATVYFEENLKMFAPLGFVPGLSDNQIEALGDPARARSAGLPTVEDGIKAGAWLVGSRELVIERLMDLQERYPGLEQVNVGCTMMSTPQSLIIEQLERFAKEVMPVFTNQTAVVADG